MQAREEEASEMAECWWVRQVIQSTMLLWLPADDSLTVEELSWPLPYQGPGGWEHPPGGGGQPGKVKYVTGVIVSCVPLFLTLCLCPGNSDYLKMLLLSSFG